LSSTLDRLHAFGEAVGAEVSFEADEWVARLELVGYWPIPGVDVAFGKRSSCVLGSDTPLSCVEVELTHRARAQGWVGGWISSYNPADRRFPREWRPALISEAEARSLIAQERPEVAVALAGIPDLIFVRDGLIVAPECKRQRGPYRDENCQRKVGGDRFRPTQLQWAADAIASGLPREALLTIWWERLDPSPCQ
jgi:hypothetical protein